MVGESEAIRLVFRMVEKAAALTVPVLICGETGTGKELVARAVHGRSHRLVRPFVDVNCAAIPESLFETELYGHERGAFTGAYARHRGSFESASGGTLFLDEVGELPPTLQAKFLRAIETGAVTPVGSQRPLKVDVRIIAATNVPLEELVHRGAFREDLYWRLNSVRIDLPPVRERKSDLPILIEHVLDRVRGEFQQPNAVLTPDATSVLLQHDWPGNVREIEQTLRQALLAAQGPSVEACDLPASAMGGHLGVAKSDFGLPRGMTLREGRTRVLARLEAAWIAAALRTHDGHQGHVAAELDIDRKTLFQKMTRYGIHCLGRLRGNIDP